MSGFLLDTNCISELIRSNPEPRVMDWMRAADESLLYLSVLTLGEIRKGAAVLPQSKRRTHLESWLQFGSALFDFRDEFWRSIMRSPTAGDGLPPRPNVKEGLWRQSTVCWPRPRSSMA